MSKERKTHDFKNRYGGWAIVTGASSGIGRAMATALGERGLNVVAVARRRDALEELAAELGARFAVQALAVPADLGSIQGFETLTNATRALDAGLLVASAGFGTSGDFLKATIDDEIAMLELNCAAVLRQSLHFGRRFAQRGRGGIVLMGSLVGRQGVPYSAHYAATKAYVQTLAEGLHRELASSGVDVLASTPGPVRSGFEARSGMRMSVAIDPDVVARGTLDALGHRGVAVPGLLSKALTYSLAPLPRPLRSRIMGGIMSDMTKDQRDRSSDVDGREAHLDR